MVIGFRLKTHIELNQTFSRFVYTHTLSILLFLFLPIDVYVFESLLDFSLKLFQHLFLQRKKREDRSLHFFLSSTHSSYHIMAIITLCLFSLWLR